jgi:hypothetical protein
VANGRGDTKVYEKEKKEIENAEHLSEEELQQLQKAENQLENMIKEEEKALEIKKDAASDLSDAFSYFKKIESELQHLDKVHDVMHSRGLSREDLSEEEMETWNKVIREGDNIQKKLEGVVQLLRDAESDIQKLEQIEADEEDKTKKEDQSLQKQIDAVEDVLTAIQDIRKLDREQA